jgi:hypothetical protein
LACQTQRKATPCAPPKPPRNAALVDAVAVAMLDATVASSMHRLMELRSDFRLREVVHTPDLPWAASPLAGVERRMLDRVGDERDVLR